MPRRVVGTKQQFAGAPEQDHGPCSLLPVRGETIVERARRFVSEARWKRTSGSCSGWRQGSSPPLSCSPSSSGGHAFDSAALAILVTVILPALPGQSRRR